MFTQWMNGLSVDVDCCVHVWRRRVNECVCTALPKLNWLYACIGEYKTNTNEWMCTWNDRIEVYLNSVSVAAANFERAVTLASILFGLEFRCCAHTFFLHLCWCHCSCCWCNHYTFVIIFTVWHVCCRARASAHSFQITSETVLLSRSHFYLFREHVLLCVVIWSFDHLSHSSRKLPHIYTYKVRKVTENEKKKTKKKRQQQSKNENGNCSHLKKCVASAIGFLFSHLMDVRAAE